jgi:hypothetical protein
MTRYRTRADKDFHEKLLPDDLRLVWPPWRTSAPTYQQVAWRDSAERQWWGLVRLSMATPVLGQEWQVRMLAHYTRRLLDFLDRAPEGCEDQVVACRTALARLQTEA